MLGIPLAWVPGNPFSLPLARLFPWSILSQVPSPLLPWQPWIQAKPKQAEDHASETAWGPHWAARLLTRGEGEGDGPKHVGDFRNSLAATPVSGEKINHSISTLYSYFRSSFSSGVMT